MQRLQLNKPVDIEVAKTILCDPNETLNQWREGIDHYYKFIGKKGEKVTLSINRLPQRREGDIRGVVLTDLPEIHTRATFTWCKYLGIKTVDDQKLVDMAFPLVEKGGRVILTREILNPSNSFRTRRPERPYGDTVDGHSEFCEELSADIAPLGVALFLCGMSKFCAVTLPLPQRFFVRTREVIEIGHRMAIMVSRAGVNDPTPSQIRLVAIPDHPDARDKDITRHCLVIPARVTLPQTS